MLLNPDGLVWIGRRADKPNAEGAANGGRCRKAASTRARTRARPRLRELPRKPRSARPRSSPRRPNGTDTICPTQLIGKSWGGKYRGQTQKWFALRFTGEDSEVDLKPPGHKQEFDQWRWAQMDEILRRHRALQARGL